MRRPSKKIKFSMASNCLFTEVLIPFLFKLFEIRGYNVQDIFFFCIAKPNQKIDLHRWFQPNLPIGTTFRNMNVNRLIVFSTIKEKSKPSNLTLKPNTSNFSRRLSTLKLIDFQIIKSNYAIEFYHISPEMVRKLYRAVDKKIIS